MAFSFLDKIRSKFEAQFGALISAAIPFAMNTEFAPVLASEMKRANSIGAQEPVTTFFAAAGRWPKTKELLGVVVVVHVVLVLVHLLVHILSRKKYHENFFKRS